MTANTRSLSNANIRTNVTATTASLPPAKATCAHVPNYARREGRNAIVRSYGGRKAAERPRDGPTALESERERAEGGEGREGRALQKCSGADAAGRSGRGESGGREGESGGDGGCASLQGQLLQMQLQLPGAGEEGEEEGERGIRTRRGKRGEGEKERSRAREAVKETCKGGFREGDGARGCDRRKVRESERERERVEKVGIVSTLRSDPTSISDVAMSVS